MRRREVVVKLRHVFLIVILTVVARAQVTHIPMFQRQDNQGRGEALSISYATTPPVLDCSTSTWEEIPEFILSRESGAFARVEAKNQMVVPVAARSDDDVNSFKASYRFRWDGNKLYGYVKTNERNVDSQHPATSERKFRQSPETAAFDDLFHSTVIVEVAA